jgi:hypothetical protein
LGWLGTAAPGRELSAGSGTPAVARHLGHGVHVCARTCAHGEPALLVLAHSGRVK